MRDELDIELCEPAPFIYYENGQLAVTDGAAVWLVIVTHEALKATRPSLDDPLRCLTRHAELYRDLAAAAIRHRNYVDGKVWVTEAMVHAALSTAHAAPRSQHASKNIDHAQRGP